MRTRIVLWGQNENDERVLIAAALNAEENKVDIWAFPEYVATESFAQKLTREWRNKSQDIEFPAEHRHWERPLSISEPLLPEELKTDNESLLAQARSEWHFVVLSNKLKKVFEEELEELKGRVDELTDFDSEQWERLKEFWEKVQTQMREGNLFREHFDALRKESNALFGRMKELRSKADAELKAKSREVFEKFQQAITDIEHKINEGLGLQGLWQDLVKLQREFRESELVREHRNKIWKRLDAAFKEIKSRRFGDEARSGANALERLQKRYDGLLAAIQKMERSIKRDHDELAFQRRRIENTDGQLEAQIRAAKIKMIEERVQSKEAKLAEMHKTREMLEGKLEKAKAREARRKAKEQEEQAAQAAAPETSGSSAQESPAPESNGRKSSQESLMGAIGSALGESLTDVVDTIKAVAEVVSERVEEAIEDLQEKTLSSNDQPPPQPKADISMEEE